MLISMYNNFLSLCLSFVSTQYTSIPFALVSVVEHSHSFSCLRVSNIISKAMLKLSTYQIDGCQAKVEANHWPVETHIMRAQELTFPDNYFDVSFTNFIVADLDGPKIVAQHLYHTLKPGGKAILYTFAFRPHDAAIKAAHFATRGPNARLRLAYDPEWF